MKNIWNLSLQLKLNVVYFCLWCLLWSMWRLLRWIEATAEGKTWFAITIPIIRNVKTFEIQFPADTNATKSMARRKRYYFRTMRANIVSCLVKVFFKLFTSRRKNIWSFGFCLSRKFYSVEFNVISKIFFSFFFFSSSAVINLGTLGNMFNICCRGFIQNKKWRKRRRAKSGKVIYYLINVNPILTRRKKRKEKTVFPSN